MHKYKNVGVWMSLKNTFYLCLAAQFIRKHVTC